MLGLLHLLHLNVLEGTHTFEHLVEVDLMAVKLRTVNANKLGLSTYGDAASTAHACTVYHDGVERYVGRNLIFLGEQTHELHHDGGTNGKALVYLLALDDALDTLGHETLVPIRAVIGHDYYLVGTLAHLVLQYDKVFGAACKHGDDAVARSLQCLYDGEHGSYTYATTGTHYGAVVLDVGRLSEGTYDVGNLVAHVEVADLSR